VVVVETLPPLLFSQIFLGATMAEYDDMASFAKMFSNSNAGGKMAKNKVKKKAAASKPAGRSRPVANKTAGMPNKAQRTDTMRGMPNRAQAVKKAAPTSAAQMRAQESGKNRSGGSAASKRKMESSSARSGPKNVSVNVGTNRTYEKVKPKNTGSARAFEGVAPKNTGSARSFEQPRAKRAGGSARSYESPSTPKKYGSARSVEQPMKKDRSNTSAAARRKMESRSR
jgi:hypothetical protein